MNKPRIFCKTRGKTIIAHRIIRTEPGETLVDSMPPSPCTDYYAKCGEVGLEHGVNTVILCETITEAQKHCAAICPKCYHSQDEWTVIHPPAGVSRARVKIEQLCFACKHDTMTVSHTITGAPVEISTWKYRCECGNSSTMSAPVIPEHDFKPLP